MQGRSERSSVREFSNSGQEVDAVAGDGTSSEGLSRGKERTKWKVIAVVAGAMGRN